MDDWRAESLAFTAGMALEPAKKCLFLCPLAGFWGDSRSERGGVFWSSRLFLGSGSCIVVVGGSWVEFHKGSQVLGAMGELVE